MKHFVLMSPSPIGSAPPSVGRVMCGGGTDTDVGGDVGVQSAQPNDFNHQR